MATNIGTLLLGELQALSTEARRKHPEIKEAAERVIVVMRGIKATGNAQIAAELAKSDDVVGPFVLGCKSGQHKLVVTSVQCLQQLVSHQAVSQRSIRTTLSTLNTVGHLGTDIQVKVLQMVLPLVTMYDGCVFGETLVEALHLCLALQRSRDLIVNNTAAAILRQVVVAVFDRVVAEDREHAASDGDGDSIDTTDRDMTRRYAKDAYFVLQDLCLLAAGSDSIFIRVDAVDQGLVLDLLESVLANHAAVIARHTAMVQILRERLAPFLVEFFADKAPFTLAMRCIRIVWLFVRDLHGALAAECEVLLALLARLIDPGAARPVARRQSISAQHPVALVPSKSAAGGGLPLFYRVLAMEVARLVLQDTQLLCRLYAQYDGRGSDDCRIVADLVAAVANVASEHPDLRASSGGNGGSGIPAADSGAQLADGTVDPRAGQLGAHNSSLRAELHRLLDKHDPPGVPETYLVFLALTSVVAVADGLATQALELCSRTVTCGGPDAATGLVLDPARTAELADDAQAAAAAGLMGRSWPALHAVCAFYLAVRLDDALFGQLLGAVRQLAQMCGALGLDEARNAFVLLLCRGSLPQAAIADHERQLQQTPGSAQQQQQLSEAGGAPPLVTSSLAGVAFGMHARQVECLRAAAACAQFLAPVLGAMWYPVMVTLQQAEELLYQSHRAQAADAAGGSDGPSSDLRLVRADCARLLAFTRASGAEAIGWTLRAMCVLGADLSNAPVAGHVAGADEAAMRAMPSVIHRRLSAALSRPTFAIEQLRAFAVRNIDLVVGAAPGSEPDGAAAWQVIVQHLLATTAHQHAPAPMRSQAGAAVADIVLAAMGVVAQAPEAATDEADGARFAALVRSGEAQVRILTPLLQMMAGRSADVCRLTLDTVHRLLQASGRWIQGAWGVVFDVIRCVFDGPPVEAKQPGALMRCAFPCLQLIYSDYLEDLPVHCLRRCIESMALFGRQTEDLNIALTAIGQAWALCDFLQGARVSGLDDGEPQQLQPEPAGLTSAALAGGAAAADTADQWWCEELAGLGSLRTRQVLWILLLRALADLGRDRRHEVRLGATQTLFRTLEMHGSSFDTWMWDGAVWVVVLPLAADALAERARVFGLIQSGRLADLADPHDTAEMATKSGVVAEDPARLHRRQWDETAATALQGAVRIWAAHPAVWTIGHADQAWQLAWHLVQAFFAGDPGPTGVHPDTQCGLELDVPACLVDEPAPADALLAAEQRAYLRTRDSTTAAIDCAAALVSGGAGAAEAVRWRVGWRAWLAMGAAVCRVPDGAAPALNTDSQGAVPVTQDALCAYLQLCPALVGRLRTACWFAEADCRALVTVVRLVLSFVDAPLHAADDVAPTKLQALALDSVMLVAVAADGDQPAGDPRLVDRATATALALRELALLAAAPYALRTEAPPLGEFAVTRRAAAAFSPVVRRLDVLADSSTRRTTRPTLVAVAAAALDRLGEVLSAPDLPDSALAHALLCGVWQDAAVAMGLHLVAPPAPGRGAGRRSSDWFVRAVPPAVLRLRTAVDGTEDGRAALAGAWTAVGAVLAAALGGSDLPTGVQVALLDTVAAVSLQYVATSDRQPAEVAEYWATLVQIVERAAEPAAEPSVLLGADNGGPGDGAIDDEGVASDGACGPQALALAGCCWLFAMSAQTSHGVVVPAWVSAAAVPAMVRRSRAVVDAFAGERALVGRSPMPQAQIALVLRVLEGLAQLDCQPGALLLRQPDGGGSGAARQVLSGSAAHVFAMYESLVALLAVPDTAILGAVQCCLRRVSAELFG